MIVSRIMGDNRVSTFMMTIFRPLAGTLMASFIQSFFFASQILVFLHLWAEIRGHCECFI